MKKKSKIVIQFALAIAAASFFEVQRKKRYSGKRGPKGNAQIIKVEKLKS